MSLTVSNIAWEAEDEAAALQLLARRGVRAIEVAPSKIWPDWIGATPQAAARYREELRSRGFAVSSLQAVLYGKPECRVFDPTGADRLIEHLKLVAELAAALGAGVMVFGAPKNRLRGSLAPDAATDRAADVFARAAGVCLASGVSLCIEPNPTQYGCDFVTDSRSGARLVELVNSPGLRLHLDAAAMHLAGEDSPDTIRAAAPVLAHFHVSEPDLGQFFRPVVRHAGLAEGLSAIGYRGWVSIEMRSVPGWRAALEAAIDTVSEIYGPVLAAEP